MGENETVQNETVRVQTRELFLDGTGDGQTSGGPIPVIPTRQLPAFLQLHPALLNNRELGGFPPVHRRLMTFNNGNVDNADLNLDNEDLDLDEGASPADAHRARQSAALRQRRQLVRQWRVEHERLEALQAAQIDLQNLQHRPDPDDHGLLDIHPLTRPVRYLQNPPRNVEDQIHLNPRPAPRRALRRSAIRRRRLQQQLASRQAELETQRIRRRAMSINRASRRQALIDAGHRQRRAESESATVHRDAAVGPATTLPAFRTPPYPAEPVRLATPQAPLRPRNPPTRALGTRAPGAMGAHRRRSASTRMRLPRQRSAFIRRDSPRPASLPLRRRELPTDAPASSSSTSSGSSDGFVGPPLVPADGLPTAARLDSRRRREFIDSVPIHRSRIASRIRPRTSAEAILNNDNNGMDNSNNANNSTNANNSNNANNNNNALIGSNPLSTITSRLDDPVSSRNATISTAFTFHAVRSPAAPPPTARNAISDRRTTSSGTRTALPPALPAPNQNRMSTAREISANNARRSVRTVNNARRLVNYSDTGSTQSSSRRTH